MILVPVLTNIRMCRNAKQKSPVSALNFFVGLNLVQGQGKGCIQLLVYPNH